jgi:hypothetical protein
LQAVYPALHVKPHVPPLHDAGPLGTPVAQTCPQLPQLLTFVIVSTHVVQSVGVAEGQPDTQVEPTHAGVLALQVVPQALQLFLSDVRSTHAPLQSVYPALQVKPHVPPLHDGEALRTPVVHARLQLPQCCGLLLVSVQVPPHERPHAPEGVQHGVQLKPHDGHMEDMHAAASTTPVSMLPASDAVPESSAGVVPSSPDASVTSSVPLSLATGLAPSSPDVASCPEPGE